MAYTERELLARLIQCEAGGEGEDGMRAVASVIMNRATVPYGEFFRISQGGNVRNVPLIFRQVALALHSIESMTTAFTRLHKSMQPLESMTK